MRVLTLSLFASAIAVAIVGSSPFAVSAQQTQGKIQSPQQAQRKSLNWCNFEHRAIN
jgi:hypothetical protein